MLLVLGIFALAIIIYRYMAVNFRKKAADDLDIEFKAEFFRCKLDEPLKLTLLLQNHKMMFLPIIKITLSMPEVFEADGLNAEYAVKEKKIFSTMTSLRNYQQVLNTWEIVPRKRGYYEIECRISLINFFNTARVEIEDIEPVRIIVHPKIREIDNVVQLSSSLQGDNFVNRFINPDPMFYLGTRDYLPSDSFKDIEWKKTAQLNRLQVKIYEFTSQPEYTVLLLAEDNAGLNYETNEFVERAVNLTASIVDFIYRNKAAIQFGCNNYGKFHSMSNGAEFTHGHMVEIFDELACVTAQIKMNSEELMNDQRVIQNKSYIVICNRYYPKYDYFVRKWLANNGSVQFYVADDSVRCNVGNVVITRMEQE